MAGFGTRPAHASEACSAVATWPLGRFVPTARMATVVAESALDLYEWLQRCKEKEWVRPLPA